MFFSLSLFLQSNNVVDVSKIFSFISVNERPYDLTDKFVCLSFVKSVLRALVWQASRHLFCYFANIECYVTKF